MNSPEHCAFALAQTVVKSGVPLKGIEMALTTLTDSLSTSPDACTVRCRRCASEVIIKAIGVNTHSISVDNCPTPRVSLVI